MAEWKQFLKAKKQMLTACGLLQDHGPSGARLTNVEVALEKPYWVNSAVLKLL